MNNRNRQVLYNKVAQFIKQQPFYENYKNENIAVTSPLQENLPVNFGKNFTGGIGGSGESIDEVFEDFVLNWAKYEVFEWIEIHRNEV